MDMHLQSTDLNIAVLPSRRNPLPIRGEFQAVDGEIMTLIGKNTALAPNVP